jgi:hypothetical protein
MVEIIDFPQSLIELTTLQGRTAQTSTDDGIFPMLADFNGGGIFLARFDGESPWERHPNGDELVKIVDGETRITILSNIGKESLDLTTGTMIVVPRGYWHKFEAPHGVTVMTVTPLPTTHSSASDPRG